MLSVRTWLASLAGVLFAVGLCFCLSDPIAHAAPLLGIRLHWPFVRHHDTGRKHALLGQGPITMTARGDVDLGTRRTSLNAIGQSTTTASSAMTLGVERRTQNAALSLTDGFGYSSGTSTLGQLQADYRTPMYTMTYGPVVGGADTQLQIGGFTRGIMMSKPLRNGSYDLIAAATFQQQGTGFRALGVRRTIVNQKTSFTFTALDEAQEHGVGTNRIVDAVFKRFRPTGTATFEFALADPHGIALAADGAQPAYSIGIDRSFKHGYLSLSGQDEPTGFASLSTVTPPMRQLNVTARRDLFSSANLAFNGQIDTQQQLGGAASSDRRITVTFSNTTKGGIGTTLTDTFATSLSDAATTIDRNVGSIFTETVRGTSLSESYAVATVGGSAGLASTRQIAFAASRRAAGGYVSASDSFGTTTSDGSLGQFRDLELGYSRSVGRKFDAALQLSHTVTTTNGAPSSTLSLTTSVTRRLSNAVALRFAATRTRQAGAFTSNGTAFSADLVGPLELGAIPRTDGKGNPNLPATVEGHVYLIPGADATAAAAQQRGFGNVLVVLDSVQTQRTDATGAFEFQFVKPGQHAIAIETASLSGGLVADRQTQSFRIGGGQIANVDFGIGQFAAIAGRIYTDANGTVIPIPDVDVVVDDLQRARTGPDGRYAIGRLRSGAHKVAVATDSLPASVTFETPPEKTVQVTTGAVSAVDFVAAGLGSISGVVLFAPENGFGDLRGAKDVYVVANPGDHAAITNADGTFLIDNLPAGSYTLTLDPETLPDGQSVIQAPDNAVAVVPGGKIAGVSFKLGTAAKEVVFTFDGAKKAPFSLTLEPPKAPPGAAVRIVAKTGAKNVTGVRAESDLFASESLRYDRSLGAWIGQFIVPQREKGDFTIQAAVEGRERTVGIAALTIDGTIPLISIRTAPRKPLPGHSARVIARILAPVEEGDDVRFADGYTIKLPKPQGRLFIFDIRVWSRGLPYVSTITNARGATFPLVIR